jgi:general secretion pathway protein F
MPRFTYKAYTAQGSVAFGEIAAATREGALEALSKRGQIAFDLSEALASASVPWWQREVFGSGRLSSQNLAMFTRELASLVKAELPIDEALRIVAVQPMLPARLRQITNATLEQVLEGESLSSALSAQGRAFPEFYARLVKSGELSGSLPDVLDDLAKVLERTAETRAKVGAALVYPLVLLVAALAAIGVILAVLIPALLPVFEDAGVPPPVLIRTLAALQRAAASHWQAVLAALAALALGLVMAARSNRLRLKLDRALLRLPLIGSLIERRETARFARTLAVLTRNGVPILDTMRIAGGVLSNRAYSQAVKAAGEEIKEGGTIAGPLTRCGLFPDLFLRLTAVGEKTGHLDAMQLRIAEIYESAVERQVERLTALITPVLTLLIGGVVGGLIISVMGAIFSVNDLALK